MAILDRKPSSEQILGRNPYWLKSANLEQKCLKLMHKNYGMLLAVSSAQLSSGRRGRFRKEKKDAYGHGNRGKDPPALSSAQGGRAIRHRAGAERIEDRALARHICNHLRFRAQPRLDPGRRSGGGVGAVVPGCGR